MVSVLGTVLPASRQAVALHELMAIFGAGSAESVSSKVYALQLHGSTAHVGHQGLLLPCSDLVRSTQTKQKCGAASRPGQEGLTCHELCPRQDRAARGCITSQLSSCATRARGPDQRRRRAALYSSLQISAPQPGPWSGPESECRVGSRWSISKSSKNPCPHCQHSWTSRAGLWRRGFCERHIARLGSSKFKRGRRAHARMLHHRRRLDSGCPRGTGIGRERCQGAVRRRSAKSASSQVEWRPAG